MNWLTDNHGNIWAGKVHVGGMGTATAIKVVAQHNAPHIERARTARACLEWSEVVGASFLGDDEAIAIYDIRLDNLMAGLG